MKKNKSPCQKGVGWGSGGCYIENDFFVQFDDLAVLKDLILS